MKLLLILVGLLISVQHLNAQDGTLDSTFGNNGKINTIYDFSSTAFQSTGKLIGVQALIGGFEIYRYNLDGTLDIDFGTNGKVSMIFNHLTNLLQVKVAIQNNDNIIVQATGRGINENNVPIYYTVLTRFTNNGNADATFTNHAVLTPQNHNMSITPTALGVLNDGSIIAVTGYLIGRSISYASIDKYNNEGVLKPEFTKSHHGYTFTELEINSMDQVIIGGKATGRESGENPTLILAQYNANGTRSMGPGEFELLYRTIYSSFPFKYNPEGLYALAVQNDGKIVAASYSGKLLRFNNDGSIDSTFGIDGIVMKPFHIFRLRIQADGKIIGGGSQFIMCRINTDGSVDETFGINGISAPVVEPSNLIRDMTITGNRLYAYGGGILAAFKLNSNCTPPNFLNTLAIVGDASCNANDGQISIIPTSGTAPFMYSIDGGATYVAGPDAGYTYLNLAPGNYQLRLKDANVCESAVVNKTVITRYGLPTFLNTLAIVGDASCNTNDGQISIIPTSATGPIKYSIDGGATYVAGPDAGYTFLNLAPGNYQLRLMNGNGCESDIVEKSVIERYWQPCPSPRPNTNGLNKGMITGENSTVEKLKVSVYPNPGKGRFTLQLLQPGTGKGELLIFDAKGTLIQKSNINMSKGGLFNVNLEGKAPGLYYFKLVSPMGTSTAKVVKQ